MFVAGPPADGDRRAFADRVGQRARDTDAYALTAGGADDEHAVAVIDDHTNLDRQAIRKRRAVGDQLKALGAQEYVGGGAREVLARVGLPLGRPRALGLAGPLRPGGDAPRKKDAVPDGLAPEARGR